MREKEIGACSILVERHYVDRDYMEDHSVFYAKALQSLPNYCTRIHFFSLDSEAVARELNRIRASSTRATFLEAAALFSRESYVGFTVVKPLNGSPVGRTVLRPFPRNHPDGDKVRSFNSSCTYPVHVLGVPLTATGLAFQQQDLGVSACATTAIWSALQRTREMEQGGPATPAQITMRASQYALPFGRSMPSEGLSLDQMCQAVQSTGYSPNLIRAENFDHARRILYTALDSGIAPVLVLRQGKESWHAVVAAGMKTASEHSIAVVEDALDDISSDLLALYIHDDRFGPYLRADLQENNGHAELRIPLRHGDPEQIWTLSHLLIPLHSKIRLSLNELQQVMMHVAGSIAAYRSSSGLPIVPSRIRTRIVKTHQYLEEILFCSEDSGAALVEQLTMRYALPRYVATISIIADDLDRLDLLLDTTSTRRNLNSVALLRFGTKQRLTDGLASVMVRRYRCDLIPPLPRE